MVIYDPRDRYAPQIPRDEQRHLGIRIEKEGEVELRRWKSYTVEITKLVPLKSGQQGTIRGKKLGSPDIHVCKMYFEEENG